eukprot:CAMPEP_0119555948 /NCGR_PEP_ID=MMETSP1352-20130426/8025_1 /TAXON_ID=265584 /ORGANISM="Stauroneis constricta, Strain CCMP1120" /LENGTH=1580 /DNA_ID=CAMNT_0007602821 /DNA_START=211 /DNA_END=4953 /DNA_ORIENTATION=-
MAPDMNSKKNGNNGRRRHHGGSNLVEEADEMDNTNHTVERQPQQQQPPSMLRNSNNTVSTVATTPDQANRSNKFVLPKSPSSTDSFSLPPIELDESSSDDDDGSFVYDVEDDDSDYESIQSETQRGKTMRRRNDLMYATDEEDEMDDFTTDGDMDMIEEEDEDGDGDGADHDDINDPTIRGDVINSNNTTSRRSSLQRKSSLNGKMTTHTTTNRLDVNGNGTAAAGNRATGGGGRQHRRASFNASTNPRGVERDDMSDNTDNRHLKAQARTISVIRCLVITTLLTVAALVANIVYISALLGEEKSFETDFSEYGHAIVNGYTEQLVRVLNVADDLVHQCYVETDVTAITTKQQQQAQKETWPFVSLSNFDRLASSTRQLASISTISFLPFVMQEEIMEWEDYVKLQNLSPSFEDTYDPRSDMLEEGQGSHVQYRNTTTTTSNNQQPQGVFHVDPKTQQPTEGTSSSNACVAPVLQVAPHTTTTQQSIRFDMTSDTPQAQTLDRMAAKKSSVDAAATTTSTSIHQPRVAQILYTGTNTSIYEKYVQPIVPIYYPIVRDIQDLEYPELYGASNTEDNNDHHKQQVVVGALLFEIGLETFLEDILFAVNEPLTVVVESACGSSSTSSTKMFTYSVTGPNVEFLGSGDLFTPIRDAEDLSSNSTFESWNQVLEDHVQQYYGGDTAEQHDNDDHESTTTTTANEEQPQCSMRITVHPSKAFRSFYLTFRPIALEFGVAALFLFATGVFIVYDCLLEKRQRRVLAEATEANTLLHAHYPQQVRDRLLANAEARMQQEQQMSTKRRLKGFLMKEQNNNGPNTPLHDAGGRGSIVKRQSSTLSVASQNNRHNPSSMSSAPAVSSEPIADLFPNCSIMFGDISGFSAWSSEREPSQVFLLLETLYGGIDQVARRFGVFKVETVGDSYVAATGLPDPRDDHPVVLARFAHHALLRVTELVQILETRLGPGTGDLMMRVGIHSGPITAGVLRGDKTRFQLFGDTMNVASRMETTGKPGHIQLSKDTATLLEEQGKAHWLIKRADAVSVKGKGEMETFWLYTNNQAADRRRAAGGANGKLGGGQMQGESITIRNRQPVNDPNERYIRWNVETMMALLREVVAHREMLASVTEPAVAAADDAENAPTTLSSSDNADGINANANAADTPTGAPSATPGKTRHSRRRRSITGGNHNMKAWTTSQPGSTVLDEVKDVVKLPPFKEPIGTASIRKFRRELHSSVRTELFDYISKLADTYQSNPFHNLEHASHVVLSATKLLKRIARPDDYEGDKPSDLHDFTYGISSDPLTRFAVVFSALIHDAGHTGVPNNQLAKESPGIATKYNQKSLAEQRSVDIAWELLMAPSYENLRNCVFSNEDERGRFRQLIVNCVIATDIFDKDLSSRRKQRWRKVFGEDRFDAQDDVTSTASNGMNDSKLLGPRLSMSSSASGNKPDKEELLNLKATIVLEHVIQASDVSHTMQHWHVYCRWNERLFQEMYQAYKDGRSEKDPSVGWYKGELWFFDFYVIPLAKKLKDCGVFGVSSDEYLNYALANRAEFEEKGESIVKEMMNKVAGSNRLNKTLTTHYEGSSADENR